MLKDLWNILIGSIFILVGLLVLSLFTIWVFYGLGYKNGQLDYQRGIIEYELTDKGYKQITEDE